MELVNKICLKCLVDKPISDFYLRKKGPRAGKYYSKCKTCMKVRGVVYYHQNHKRQLKLAKKRNRAALIRGLEFLVKVKNRQCGDCGNYYPPWVMDFDHRDPTLKTDNISTLRRFHNLKSVNVEIGKCDLVCANCHRTRTIMKSRGKYHGIIDRLEKEGYRFNWK